MPLLKVLFLTLAIFWLSSCSSTAPADQSPVVIWEELPRSITTNQLLALDASQSYDPEGGPLKFTWTVEGQKGDLRPKLHRSFPAPGSYQITLSVTDGQTTIDQEQEVQVTRPNTPPVAQIALGSRQVVVGEKLRLDGAQSTDPDPGDKLSYYWSFGDGNSQSGRQVTHKYREIGTYQVALQVYDQGGLSGLAQAKVSVGNSEQQQQPPLAVIERQDQQIVAKNTMVRFTAKGSEFFGPTVKQELLWNFDNGHSARGATATQSFERSRTYNVTLAADDGQNTDLEKERVVVKERRPVAAFRYKTISADRLEFEFTTANSVDPDGDNLSFQWDFNSDGVYDDAGASVRYLFPQAGPQEVTLHVSDGRLVDIASRKFIARKRVPIQNLFVAPGDIVRYDYCDLIVSGFEQIPGSIRIDPGGKLVLNNCTVSSSGPKISYTFSVYGSLECFKVTIANLKTGLKLAASPTDRVILNRVDFKSSPVAINIVNPDNLHLKDCNYYPAQLLLSCDSTSLAVDSDHDGYGDLFERFISQTDPASPSNLTDSDHDGLSNFDELSPLFPQPTNPLHPDSDHDGLLDLVEYLGFDPDARKLIAGGKPILSLSLHNDTLVLINAAGQIYRQALSSLKGQTGDLVLANLSAAVIERDTEQEIYYTYGPDDPGIMASYSGLWPNKAGLPTWVSGEKELLFAAKPADLGELAVLKTSPNQPGDLYFTYEMQICLIPSPDYQDQTDNNGDGQIDEAPALQVLTLKLLNPANLTPTDRGLYFTDQGPSGDYRLSFIPKPDSGTAPSVTVITNLPWEPQSLKYLGHRDQLLLAHQDKISTLDYQSGAILPYFQLPKPGTVGEFTLTSQGDLIVEEEEQGDLWYFEQQIDRKAPADSDSDGDGLSDGREQFNLRQETYLTDPGGPLALSYWGSELYYSTLSPPAKLIRYDPISHQRETIWESETQVVTDLLHLNGYLWVALYDRHSEFTAIYRLEAGQNLHQTSPQVRYLTGEVRLFALPQVWQVSAGKYLYYSDSAGISRLEATSPAQQVIATAFDNLSGHFVRSYRPIFYFFLPGRGLVSSNLLLNQEAVLTTARTAHLFWMNGDLFTVELDKNLHSQLTVFPSHSLNYLQKHSRKQPAVSSIKLFAGLDFVASGAAGRNYLGRSLVMSNRKFLLTQPRAGKIVSYLRLPTDSKAPDSDDDGLVDGHELDPPKGQIATDPTLADSDRDGLSDYQELYQSGTNPTAADSDQDGLSDDLELRIGSDPQHVDTDRDGVWDAVEVSRQTDPLSHSPIARAGPDIFVKSIDENIFLDGLLSYDRDQDQLTYSWDIDAGTDSDNRDGDDDLLTGATDDVDRTGPTPPPVTYNAPGVYQVILSVADGKHQVTDQLYVYVGTDLDRDGTPDIDDHDVDGDGLTDIEEHRLFSDPAMANTWEAFTSSFAALDRNHDGLIAKGELALRDRRQLLRYYGGKRTDEVLQAPGPELPSAAAKDPDGRPSGWILVAHNYNNSANRVFYELYYNRFSSFLRLYYYPVKIVESYQALKLSLTLRTFGLNDPDPLSERPLLPPLSSDPYWSGRQLSIFQADADLLQSARWYYTEFPVQYAFSPHDYLQLEFSGITAWPDGGRHTSISGKLLGSYKLADGSSYYVPYSPLDITNSPRGRSGNCIVAANGQLFASSVLAPLFPARGLQESSLYSARVNLKLDPPKYGYHGGIGIAYLKPALLSTQGRQLSRGMHVGYLELPPTKAQFSRAAGALFVPARWDSTAAYVQTDTRNGVGLSLVCNPTYIPNPNDFIPTLRIQIDSRGEGQFDDPYFIGTDSDGDGLVDSGLLAPPQVAQVLNLPTGDRLFYLKTNPGRLLATEIISGQSRQLESASVFMRIAYDLGSPPLKLTWPFPLRLRDKRNYPEDFRFNHQYSFRLTSDSNSSLDFFGLRLGEHRTPKYTMAPGAEVVSYNNRLGQASFWLTDGPTTPLEISSELVNTSMINRPLQLDSTKIHYSLQVEDAFRLQK